MTDGERKLAELTEHLKQRDSRAMDLSELHGYLSALVTGPDIIPPGVWLPFIYNEEGHIPEEDGADAASVKMEAVDCYNQVGRSLNQGEFVPLTGYTEGGGTNRDELMKHWAEGFIKGTALWETLVPIADDIELTSMLLPIVYCIDADAVADDVEEYTNKAYFLSDETRESMYEMIPSALVMIRDYFQDIKYLDSSPAEAVLPFEVSIDQQDEWDYPCPCGSGEAFGDCCGKRE